MDIFPPDIFRDTSFGIALFNVQDFRLENVNTAMLDLWGKNHSVINQRLLDFLPELQEQGYLKKMLNVALTGTGINEDSAEVFFEKNGITELMFVDYSYLPVFGVNNVVSSILVITKPLPRNSGRILIDRGIYRNLQSIVLTSPVPMGVFTGTELKVRFVNDHMLDLWCHNHWFGNKEISHVYNNGVPYVLELGNVIYSFTPMADHLGRIDGVTIVACIK